IVAQVPAIVWTTDLDLRITSRSGAGEDSGDILPERAVGASLIEQYQSQLVGADSLEAHSRALGGESVSYQIRSGGRVYDAHVKPLYGDGQITGAVGLAMDVTSREQALDEARRSRRELEDFFEHATVGMHWVGPDGRIARANQAELEMLGYSAEEYVGRPFHEFHLDPEIADNAFRRVLAGETVMNLEARLRHKNGSLRHVLINTNGLFEDGKFVHSRAISRDITERKIAEEQLRHGAMHDPLTDLPNRAYFLERVDQAVHRARREQGYRFAVLFLDFDNFKLVNDSLGHTVGDQLLMQIAERLRNCVRPADIVARLGGDEFTVLLEEVGGLADVEQSARRIQRCLATPYQLGGRDVHSTASIGVALAGDGDGAETPEDLLRDADIAMYRAKAQGRARFQLFDASMRMGAQVRFGLENDLRTAIERGEFRLLFQPIVELKTGRIHAFEALTRWHHPERGVIRPPEFIPIAEETGLIVEIGNWAIREACWQARRWQRSTGGQGPIRISVNLSARQLRNPRLVEDVREALREEGLEASKLRLEITETALMDDVEASVTILGQLRAIGVELHMDDFGTGYSSLAYLPRFPIQTIKIDKSFTHRMGLRRTDQEIVRSIVDLARNLGIGVIAEGVENITQRGRLIEFGCQLAQGFYFAEPLEAAAAGALLETSGVATGNGTPVMPTPHH
ncbi:MAG TPA: EAL domain-containing protein, partial [Gemmatimonadales bacterium]